MGRCQPKPYINVYIYKWGMIDGEVNDIYIYNMYIYTYIYSWKYDLDKWGIFHCHVEKEGK